MKETIFQLDLESTIAPDISRQVREQQPWTQPEEELQAPRADLPEEHDWWLAGTKADYVAPVTYFLWKCRKCGRRVVTETASKDAPFMADQNVPGGQDLRRGRVDENCLQATVDAVHDL